MSDLREFLGAKCPCCSKDILQQAPSTNRMPGKELAWCPTCKSTLTLDDLARRARKPRSAGLLARLFGRPNHA